MRFKAKKVYGQYKQLTCPFCSRNATQKNEQGLDVCHLHTKNVLEEFKCTCGSWLEVRSGKFGPYFNCINCGNMNFRKGMEIKSITAANPSAAIVEKKIEVKKKQIMKDTKKQKQKGKRLL